MILLYFAGKLILAPKTRIFLGKLLEATDVAIRKTKDANVLAELRIDRALLLEILENAEESMDSAGESEVKEEK